MSMIAIPSSRWSRRISSRICVCVVTSRAVVGSSAIRRVGLHDSAIAIMARWRRPPLSWLESWSTRSSGDDTPTRLSISIARSRASRRLSFWCSRIASMIWLPTVCTGLNEDIGSWKISAISAPRIERISEPFESSRARSTVAPWPPLAAGRRKWISPSTIRPGRSTIRKMDRAVTLLPQPLSPTIPSVAPGSRSRLTPSTAFTVPSSWAKYVFRLRTERSGGRDLSSIGIGGVPQPVAQEVERHDRDDHGHRRDHQPRRDRYGLDVLRLLKENSPADRRRAQPEPQEAQRGLADDHGRQRQRGGRNDVAHERRHHVHEDRPRAATAHQPRRDDEVFLAQRQEPAAHDTRQLGPSQERDDDGDREVDLQDRPVARQGGRQAHPERDRRDRPEDLDHPLDHRVDDAAVEAREPAQHDAQNQARRHAEEPDRQRDACPVHEPRPEIAALHVGAQEKDRLGGIEVRGDADQMARHRDQAEEVVLEAVSKEVDRHLHFWIGAVDALEGLRVALSLETVDVRAKAPLVEPVDRLRRHQRALGLGGVRIRVGEKIGAQHRQIEPAYDGGAGHGHPVLAESPPHELPLRGDEDALLVGDGRHHVSSRRMRGSIQTSRMSEIKVPITVITPSSSTIVPARNMSWAISALSRSGPTVGRPRTSDTMMLPDTM